eukprot:gnl/MRDRNA2_/MRDRNA2_35131_c0_seq1.p1 gnl/MRDRNA2_/MRDRNA2_35131_c0~~gnl/MRDRNA2_/MRDRNA2_35131_c0_seq1.p1  ORF type:complete len:803 (-),score=135.53 gnl/MRDRNA2_/MRDRNA2_35131_c0_seq1:86-2494(-)
MAAEPALPTVASPILASMASAMASPTGPTAEPPPLELNRPFKADVRFGAAPAIRSPNVSARGKTSIVSPRGGFPFCGTGGGERDGDPCDVAGRPPTSTLRGLWRPLGAKRKEAYRSAAWDGKTKARLLEVEDRLIRPHASGQQMRHALGIVQQNPAKGAHKELSRWSSMKGVYTELVAATNGDSAEQLVGALTRADAQGANASQWKEVQAAKDRLATLRSLSAEMQNLLTSTSVESIEVTLKKAEALQVGDTFRYMLPLKERASALRKLRTKLEEATKGASISSLRGAITEAILRKVNEWPEYIAASDRHDELKTVHGSLLSALAGTSASAMTDAIEATENAGLDHHDWSHLRLVKSRLRSMRDEHEERTLHSALQDQLSAVAVKLRQELETMQIAHSMTEVAHWKKRMSAGTPGPDDSASPSLDSMMSEDMSSDSSGFGSGVSSEHGDEIERPQSVNGMNRPPSVNAARKPSLAPEDTKSMSRKPSLVPEDAISPKNTTRKPSLKPEEAPNKEPEPELDKIVRRPSLLDRRPSAVKLGQIDTRRLSIDKSATQSSWQAVEDRSPTLDMIRTRDSVSPMRSSQVKAQKEADETRRPSIIKSASQYQSGAGIESSPTRRRSGDSTVDHLVSPRKPSLGATTQSVNVSPRRPSVGEAQRNSAQASPPRRPSLVAGATTRTPRTPRRPSVSGYNATSELRKEAKNLNSRDSKNLDSVMEAARSMDRQTRAEAGAEKWQDYSDLSDISDWRGSGRVGRSNSLEEGAPRRRTSASRPLVNTQNLLIQTRVEAIQGRRNSGSQAYEMF